MINVVVDYCKQWQLKVNHVLRIAHVQKKRWNKHFATYNRKRIVQTNTLRFTYVQKESTLAIFSVSIF